MALRDVEVLLLTLVSNSHVCVVLQTYVACESYLCENVRVLFHF